MRARKQVLEEEAAEDWAFDEGDAFDAFEEQEDWAFDEGVVDEALDFDVHAADDEQVSPLFTSFFFSTHSVLKHCTDSFFLLSSFFFLPGGTSLQG